MAKSPVSAGKDSSPAPYGMGTFFGSIMTSSCFSSDQGIFHEFSLWLVSGGHDLPRKMASFVSRTFCSALLMRKRGLSSHHTSGTYSSTSTVLIVQSSYYPITLRRRHKLGGIQYASELSVAPVYTMNKEGTSHQ